ncbi:MAG: TolC family protein [Phycisphaerales bacterium]|nr:TolC family protein [Phycisphaerales bacterium]
MTPRQSERPAPPRSTRCLARPLGLFLGIAVLGGSLPGCEGPLRKTNSEQELRRALNAAVEQQVRSPRPADVPLKAEPSRLEGSFIPANRMDELNRMAGPAANAASPAIEFGEDLTGEATRTVQVSLREAILSAVQNNLSVQFGAITPAMREAEITRAEARFDAVFFSNLSWGKIDQPSIVPLVRGNPLGSGIVQRDERTLSSGLRQNLIGGGRLTLQSAITRAFDSSPEREQTPEPAYTSSVELILEQPLLRGFGSESNLSEIRLSRNAHRREVETYRRTLLETVARTEGAYWNLVAARQALRVRERLLTRGVQTEDKLKARGDYDATPSQVSDAVARVQTRRVDVMRARDEVLRASDELKQLMNAPGLSVGTEIVMEPTDVAIADGITFNYADIIATTLQNRPELRQALLAIDDASIRQMLADNLRLPALDLSATVRWNGLDNSFEDSYNRLGEQDFIDYILQLRFEHPIGNREAQANFRVARLSRVQSVVGYRQAVDNVILDVKSALRSMRLNFELLVPTRDARLAAAENLRTIEVEEALTASTTPEFLNLKFQRQESLAQAELEEIRAMVNYQIAVANLYNSMGIGLERNQIKFVVPEPAE